MRIALAIASPSSESFCDMAAGAVQSQVAEKKPMVFMNGLTESL